METKQIVQSSAKIIKITSIEPGNVYKRFNDSSYDNDKMYYGIVRKVYNDGEKTFIEAIEYKRSYSSIDVELKIIRGIDDVNIFPANPEDLELEFGKVLEKLNKEIEEYKEGIQKKEMLINDVNSILSGEKMKSLSTMGFEELPTN